MTHYYNPGGSYKAYSNDGKNLYSESGQHIGYFLNGFLYSTSGESIGYVRDKWIYDNQGRPLYYTT